MKRKHFVRFIVCITIFVWLLSGVKGEVNTVEQDTVVMSQKSSDKIQDGDVVDKNDEYAALKGLPLGAEEQIVVASDRELKPGSRVRMAEGDE